MITIGLLTNDVTSGNYGVNALSISNILFLEDACNKNNINHKYVIFGNPKKKDQFRKKILNVPELENIQFTIAQDLEFRKVISTFFSFRKTIKECDIVFDTSGGDSFADIYGNKRIIHQLLPKMITNVYKIPLIFTPQTIGPFENIIWKRIASRVARKSHMVFVRDKMSYEYCKKEMSLSNVKEVTDMAMRLPYKEYDRSLNNSPLKIGLNISGLLFNGGYNKNNQFGLKAEYKTVIKRIIEELVKSREYEIHLVPHVIADGIEGDNIVSSIIKKEYPEVIYEKEFSDPIEAKSYICQMDLFIGSRMHSTIAAISSGVPTIPLSYSRKFEGLFSSIGYMECIDLKTNDENQIISQIHKKIDNLKTLQSNVERSRKSINKRIQDYEDAISDLIVRVSK